MDANQTEALIAAFKHKLDLFGEVSRQSDRYDVYRCKKCLKSIITFEINPTFVQIDGAIEINCKITSECANKECPQGKGECICHEVDMYFIVPAVEE